MDTVNTELIRGHVDTIILNSLAERDRYGYEILDIIADLSEGRYEIKQPTLYSCLKRLEKQGFIDSYFGDESNGGRRRYYKLTDKGRETLEQDQREWEFSRTIINRLLSDREIDLKTVEAPFNPNELRPLTRRVKAHESGEEVAATDIPAQNVEPIIKYVYVPQYIQVPVGSPLPQNGVLPEGAVLANPDEIPEEVRADNIIQQPQIVEENVVQNGVALNNVGVEQNVIQNNVDVVEQNAIENNILRNTNYFSFLQNEDETNIPTPTEQEALNALYSLPTDNNVINNNVIVEEQVNTISSQNVEEQIVDEAVEQVVQTNEIDEETALTIKEQQTKASRLLGIGEFATHRNLIEDPVVAENENDVVNSSQNNVVSYNNDNNGDNVINYREALSAFFGTTNANNTLVQQASLNNQAEAERIENTTKARHFGDVKQSLYEDGFKLKVYQKANTLNHYYLKFIYSNRINRDTALLTYLVLVIELLVMIIAKKVFGTPITYVIIGAVGVLLPLIPTLVWVMNPTKRIRAQFNLTQSLTNAGIAFIIISAITIVVSLLLDANMKSGVTYAPIIIALNIPISVVIYGILYKSNNYHLKK